MCEKTAGDITARMALVPRTMEARGLDATPQIQAKLRQVGTPDALAAVAVLDVILKKRSATWPLVTIGIASYVSATVWIHNPTTLYWRINMKRRGRACL